MLQLVLIPLIAFPFLCPEEFVYWSRRVRRWLRDDFHKRVNFKQWEEYKRVFEDLD